MCLFKPLEVKYWITFFQQGTNNIHYYMADWFRVLWLVNSRSVSSRTDLQLLITFSKPE